MEKKLTFTRADLIAAITSWNAQAEKTPDGKAYADPSINDPVDCADALIHFLEEQA